MMLTRWSVPGEVTGHQTLSPVFSKLFNKPGFHRELRLSFSVPDVQLQPRICKTLPYKGLEANMFNTIFEVS